MSEAAIAQWSVPDEWRGELVGLIDRFGPCKGTKRKGAGVSHGQDERLTFCTKDFETVSVVRDEDGVEQADEQQRTFLVSDFRAEGIDEIISEALRYLRRTLIQGFCDVIYPNWGDAPLDLLQLIAGMRDVDGAYPQKLPRHNDWPMRGAFTQMVKKRCFTLGKLDCNVLVTGPSGCGKEAIARLIHRSSHHTGAFVAVSIPAIPPNLLQGVLFGYERGAYTDAQHAQTGVFERAEGDTVFLDEVADMEGPQQASLLRALSEKRACTIGATHHYPVTCRVISATNHAERLWTRFRPDLRIRLAEYEVRHASAPDGWELIRPLNLVREQIPLLFAMQFLRCFREQIGFGVKVPDFTLTVLNQKTDNSRDALRMLSQLDWAMNFRQMHQMCLNALVRHLCGFDSIRCTMTDACSIETLLSQQALCIELKSSSRHDQQGMAVGDLPDGTLRDLVYGQRFAEGKRWDNIAEWIRRQAVEYLLRNGAASNDDVAEVLNVDRSCISRFRSQGRGAS